MDNFAERQFERKVNSLQECPRCKNSEIKSTDNFCIICAYPLKADRDGQTLDEQRVREIVREEVYRVFREAATYIAPPAKGRVDSRELLNARRAAAKEIHGKAAAATTADFEKCIMAYCEEVGTLELEDGRKICETCTQIAGELADMNDHDTV